MSQTDITVTISSATPTLTQPGFGTMLMLGYTTPLVRSTAIGTYTDMDGVAVDYLPTAPESIAATAFFAQPGHAEKLKIAKGALPPTLAYTVGVQSVKNTHAYQVEVFGSTFASTLLTFTSDGSATNDEIVSGLVTALSAVSGRNYAATATGSVGSQVVSIVGTSAGNWFSVRIIDPNDLSCTSAHADPGVATDLQSINTIDSDWYALHTMYNSKAYVLAAEAWVQTHDKLYAWDVTDTQALNAGVGALDTGDASKTLAYTRSGGNYYDDPSKMMTAALYGATLGYDPGGVNFKWKTLVGVPPVTTLTDTSRANLAARNMGSYELRFGRGCTFEGHTFDGLFFDLLRNRDWVTQTMIVRVAQPLFDNPNVPMNDRGIAIFDSKMKGVLAEAVAKEVALNDPKPTTTVPKAKDITSADRIGKILRNLRFAYWAASGVNQVKITGNILF